MPRHLLLLFSAFVLSHIHVSCGKPQDMIPDSFPNVEIEKSAEKIPCPTARDFSCVHRTQCIDNIDDYPLDYYDSSNGTGLAFLDGLRLRRPAFFDIECLELCDDDIMVVCENTKILPTTTFLPEVSCDALEGFKCVPQTSCRNGRVATSGDGLLTIRGPDAIEINPENSKCPGSLEVCCYLNPIVNDVNGTGSGIPMISGPFKEPPEAEKLYIPGCGRRQPQGYSVAVRDLRNPSQAQFAEWPNMCIVQHLNVKTGEYEFVGGASLITSAAVITVAHNVNNTPPELISVRCGDWELRNISEPLRHQERKARHVVVHPRYSERGYHYNIAVIHLETNFTLAPHIDTTCLVLSDDGDLPSYDPTACYAPGWGKDNIEADQYQTILRNIKLPIVKHEECQELLRGTALSNEFKLGQEIICAGGNGQVGITSWGIGCGLPGIPAAYTSVSKTKCFIRWAVQCFGGDKYDSFLGSSDIGCENFIDREINYFEQVLRKIEQRKARFSPGSIQYTTAEENKAYFSTLYIKATNMKNSCKDFDNEADPRTPSAPRPIRRRL